MVATPPRRSDGKRDGISGSGCKRIYYSCRTELFYQKARTVHMQSTPSLPSIARALYNARTSHSSHSVSWGQIGSYMVNPTRNAPRRNLPR